MVFVRPNDAFDDSPKLLLVDVYQYDKAVVYHSLEEDEEVDPYLDKAIEILGD